MNPSATGTATPTADSAQNVPVAPPAVAPPQQAAAAPTAHAEEIICDGFHTPSYRNVTIEIDSDGSEIESWLFDARGGDPILLESDEEGHRQGQPNNGNNNQSIMAGPGVHNFPMAPFPRPPPHFVATVVQLPPHWNQFDRTVFHDPSVPLLNIIHDTMALVRQEMVDAGNPPLPLPPQ